MMEGEREKLLTMETNLAQRVVGQDMKRLLLFQMQYAVLARAYRIPTALLAHLCLLVQQGLVKQS